MWSTTTYCAACDARVSNRATECRKCGAVFGSQDDAGPCCRAAAQGHERDCFALDS